MLVPGFQYKGHYEVYDEERMELVVLPFAFKVALAPDADPTQLDKVSEVIALMCMEPLEYRGMSEWGSTN